MTDSMELHGDPPTLSEALPAIAALLVGVPALTGLAMIAFGYLGGVSV